MYYFYFKINAVMSYMVNQNIDLTCAHDQYYKYFSILENSKRPDVYSELKEPEELAVHPKGMKLAVADTGINYVIDCYFLF